MKRSEMLQHLRDHLDSWGWDDEKVLLDFLEALGVQPPLNEQEYHHMDNDDRITLNKASKFFTWEPEDGD